MAIKEQVIKQGNKLREKRTNKEYMSNVDFTNLLKEWKKSNQPNLTNDIGKNLLLLVNKIGNSRKYSGYTYLEDMKSEALLTCCKYAHNFNPEKSSNAFAYFSMIIDHSFIMFLKKEKIQHKIKYEQLDELMQSKNFNNIDLFKEE